MPPFQDESDDCILFGSEPDEIDSDSPTRPFQVEPDEPVVAGASGAFRQVGLQTEDAAFSASSCFGVEEDERFRSDSELSGGIADDETDQQVVTQRGLVALSFSTLSQFMSTQLARPSEKFGEVPKKKRKYDNSKRAAAATASKEVKLAGSTKVRVPRNDGVSCHLF